MSLPRTSLARALAPALAGVLAWGCDFGIGGGGGCARISQGDYTFPEKEIVQASIAARVTQSGMDFLTRRIKSLVLAFFDADASGRAILPLGDLGVGSLSTGLGPLEAEVRDLVLTLDLSRLDVTLVPGSSPARLEVYVEDAEVGLVDGTVAGVVDGFLFSGDVACGLADGPDGRLARVTMRLVLELATDAFGALDVNVLPSVFDLQDVAITMVTDCDRPECLDGLPAGSTSECLECETICPAADFAADLVTIVQDVFDDLVDQLMNVLADELANLVLDGFLNGKPLAVEGTLDLAPLLSPILAWLEGARPLGVLAKPAGQAFRVTGAGPTLGLDVVLDAGLDVPTPHACVGSGWNERDFQPGPRPTFDGFAQTEAGLVPYDLGLGVSAAIVNEAVWELWKAGALCIAVDTEDLANLSGGRLVLTARTLDLLLPGAADIAGADAPVRIVVRPRLDLGPEYVRVGAGGAAPLLSIALADASVAVEALVADGWLRLITFEADLVLGLAMQPRDDGTIEIGIADVALDGLALPPDNQIFAGARLDVIAPFVVELALGFLTEQPLTFDLGLSGLVSGLGVPLDAIVAATGPAGDQGDWLAFYVQLRDPVTPRSLSPALAIEASGPGWMRVLADGAERYQVRVAGGRWSRTLAGPGPHRVEAARLWLVGRWPVELRAVDAYGRAGPAHVAGEVVIERPALAPAPVAPVLVPGPPASGRPPDRAASPPASGTAGGGCAGGAPSVLGLLLWLSWSASVPRARRR